MFFIVSVLILVILLGYLRPKSKVIFVAEVLLNIVIIGGYNGNGDLDNYIYRYNNKITTNEITEGLFDLTAKLFSSNGISFEVFHFTISIIAIGLIAYTVFKLSKRPALAMALLTGYSTLEYALQLKALCAAGIISISIYYFYKKVYLQKNTLKNKIVYVGLIFLASGFHFMSIFFLLFLLIDMIDAKKLIRLIVFLTIVITIFSPYIVNQLSKYIFNITYYINLRRSPIAIFSFCVWQIISLLIVKRIMLTRVSYKDDEASKYDLFVYKGSWILLLIMPFYSITLIVNRLVKIWSAFFYVQASNIPFRKNFMSLEKLLMATYSIGSFILFYMILLDMSGNTYNVLLDVLKNNIFWRY